MENIINNNRKIEDPDYLPYKHISKKSRSQPPNMTWYIHKRKEREKEKKMEDRDGTVKSRVTLKEKLRKCDQFK